MINLELCLILSVLQFAVDSGEPILINDQLVTVTRLSPLCQYGIPGYYGPDGEMVPLKLSDDVRVYVPEIK